MRSAAAVVARPGAGVCSEAIVSRWSNEIVRIVNLPDVRSRILDLGGEPVGNSPAAFDAYQKAEATRWAKIIRESGAKMN